MPEVAASEGDEVNAPALTDDAYPSLTEEFSLANTDPLPQADSNMSTQGGSIQIGGSNALESSASELPQFASGFSHEDAWFNQGPMSLGTLSQGMSQSATDWHSKTHKSLNDSKLIMLQARKIIESNDKAHEHSMKKAWGGSGTVTDIIKKKISGTRDLVKALEDRIDSVEDTLRQVGECLFSLQRSFRSKWGPLSVCERRLDLRQGRPMQELVEDDCQKALLAERRTLLNTRQELSERIECMKEMLVTLDTAKGELIEDLQHKRHALRIDRSCLNPKKATSVASSREQDRLVLPPMSEVVHYSQPASPKDDQSTGRQNDMQRRADTRELLAKVLALEESAMTNLNESDAAMLDAKRACTQASGKALAALQRKVEETNGLRKQLESQLAGTDETIKQTGVSLIQTKKKLEMHDQPLRVLDKQFAMRGERTSREAGRDYVYDQMESQLQCLQDNVRDLTEKHKTTKDILDQLTASKQTLQEDLRAKCAAQKIDDACMKVTPRKAMELDRMDPRGGRCREPAKRKPFSATSSTIAAGNSSMLDSKGGGFLVDFT